MQVYADLRVLTARPTVQEEKRAPHRLFGHVDGAEAYSAARWAAEARGAIAEAHAAGRLPILVGGTGMYLRTLVEGIAPVPGDRSGDPRRGARHGRRPRAMPSSPGCDPETAAQAQARRYCPGVAARSRSSAPPASPLGAWQAQRSRRHRRRGPASPRRSSFPTATWLADRIDRRFRHMVHVAQGEVAALLARTDVPPDAPVLRAIGVREIGLALQGESNFEEAAFRRARSPRATMPSASTPGSAASRRPEWERTDETQTNRLVVTIRNKITIMRLDA